MAKPNYQYEKRQRELAKKQKKEEKLRRKSTGTGGQDGDAGSGGAVAENTPAEMPAPVGTQPGAG